MKNFMQKFIGILALLFTMSFTVNSQEIGDIYQGGYIFQINEDGTGLVSALEDLTEGGTDPYGWGFNGYEWGCYGEYVEGADGQAIGTGYQNTMDIVNQGCSTENVGITAAQAALDAELNGYNDWYLPSKEELEEMYNTIGSGGSEGNIGIFDVTISWSLYLSSSEYYNYSAWGVNFTDGTTVDYGKASTLRVRVIRSVTFGEDEEVATQNTPLDLPQGWSMFGYTCMDSLDAMLGFSSISDNIEIVKDEWGLSYLPSWGFNAMGSLQFSEGYQIKMIEQVDGFQFCEAIVPEDGITLADVDAAVAAITPEDGIGQADVDAAATASYAYGVASVDITSNDADVYAEGAASVTPEDGIGQADVDAVQQQLTAANQTISELQAEGVWSYPPEDYSWYWGDVALCLEGDAFMCANAAQYLAEYNASDSDIPWEIEGCVNTIGMGWDIYYAAQYSCPEALIHPLLLADFFGATYVDECGVPNGDNSSCSDECGVPNGDNSTCSDCAGVANGTSIDLGCGCGNPLPQSGYDCDGEVQTLQIGVLHAGGRVFQINEDGTGLVADLQDLGQMNWYEALDVAASTTSQGYDDWYLPNFEELKLMYNTIGQGADNAGGFEYDWYWSSTTYTNPGNPFLEGNGNYAWTVNFNDGNTFNFGKGDTRRVRVIRAF
jgi:hypothetical protein